MPHREYLPAQARHGIRLIGELVAPAAPQFRFVAPSSHFTNSRA